MKKDEQVNLLVFLLDHMAQGILYIDHTGTITVVNHAAEKLLGKSKNDLIDHHYGEVIDETLFGFSISEALHKKQLPDLIDIEYLGSDEPEILEINPTIVPESNGNHAFGLIILIRNVTEIRRLETVASRKSRLQDLGELASVIGHELRNPLGGIKGFASLLARELNDGSKLKSMAENILKGADDLNSILTQLLDYSHPKSLQIAQEDLVLLIRDVIQLMKADEAVKEKAQIVYSGPDEAVDVEIDATQIRSVLINLILNAAQAIEDKGTITIHLKTGVRDVRVLVEDDGPGIPEEVQQKIFRPYFTTKAKGSGFGLAESTQIINSHQGTITVNSEPGKGAKFTISIPRTHED